VKASVSDLATFSEIWEQHVSPRLEELLPQISEVFSSDPTFKGFAERYRRAALRAGALAAQPSLAASSKKGAELEAALRQAFGETAAGTLSQRTVRALAMTPGVDVVLVGMRRRAYVEDVLKAFS
jgi:aryl-alcohol dehydrogenase-like predicted oxidoreductase